MKVIQEVGKIGDHKKSYKKEKGRTMKNYLEKINAQLIEIKNLSMEVEKVNRDLDAFLISIPWEAYEESTLEELKAVVKLINARHYKIPIWGKLNAFIDERKIAEHPEYAVVKFFPTLLEAEFLTTEEKKTVDSVLAHYRKGQFLNSALPQMNLGVSKIKTLCEFLVAKGMAIHYKMLKCPNCGDTMATYRDDEMSFDDGLACNNCDEYFEKDELGEGLSEGFLNYQLIVERNTDFMKL